MYTAIKNSNLLPSGMVAGVQVQTPTRSQLINELEAALSKETNAVGQQARALFTLNPEILMVAFRDKRFAKALRSGTWNVVDGIGLAVALRRRNIATPERLCGSDLIHDLARLACNSKRALLIVGGLPDRLSKACKRLEDTYDGLQVTGISPPYSPRLPLGNQSEIEALIQRQQPGIVVVCLGAPKQETWIVENQQMLSRHDVRIVAGLGGTVDFLSGEIPRAPGTFRKLGLEWLYRLAIEPSRWKRQLISLPGFALRALFDSKFVRPFEEGGRRVVVYAHYVPPHPSASATRMLSLARFLRRNGCAVTLLTSQSGLDQHDGFPIVRCKGRLGLIAWLMRSPRCPILVSSPPGTPAAEVAMFARISGYRVIVDIRDPFVSEAMATGDLKPGAATLVKKWLEISMFSVAHGVSFVSPQLRETMRQLIGKLHDPTVIAPNGIDRSIFYRDEETRGTVRSRLGFGEDPVFVYAGILGGKALDEAFLALIPSLQRGARLVVIGVVDPYSRPIYARLKQLMVEHEVQNQVVWQENLPSHEVAALLNACDIGLNTLPEARAYCLPVKTYEYLACGLYNLAFSNEGGALSAMLNDKACGVACTTWKAFELNALRLCDEIATVRGQSKQRAVFAQQFDRDESNRVLADLLFCES